jgi:hypothetical protein
MAASGRKQPRDMAALEARLRARAQDSDATVAARMAKSAEEMSHRSEYDYVIVNRDLDERVAEVQAILTAERLRRTARSASPISSTACAAADRTSAHRITVSSSLLRVRFGWIPVLHRDASGRRGCADSGRSDPHGLTGSDRPNADLRLSRAMR